MTRPIIRGIIGEVLAVCALGRIVNEAVDLATKIKAKDESLVGKQMCSVFSYDDLMAEPKFWEDKAMMNNLVASILERLTMEVANPILESIDGTTHEDIAEICSCTDLVQIQAVPRVMDICATKWTRLTIRPVAEQVAEREAEFLSGLGILFAGLMSATMSEEDED